MKVRSGIRRLRKNRSSPICEFTWRKRTCLLSNRSRATSGRRRKLSFTARSSAIRMRTFFLSVYSAATSRSTRRATPPSIGDRSGNVEFAFDVSHGGPANADAVAAIFAEQFAAAFGELARAQFAFAEPLRPIRNEGAMH